MTRISERLIAHKINDEEMVIYDESAGEKIVLSEEEAARIAALIAYFFPAEMMTHETVAEPSLGSPHA